MKKQESISYGNNPDALQQWIKNMWYKYTTEFYSAIRNNDMWFEGKWMQLEDIMLNEVRER
jgi:hypothetical protein